MSMTTPNHKRLVGRAETQEIKLLDEVRGSLQGMVKRKLPYQMDYSVRTLEKLLIDEGNIHVLDLRVTSKYSENFEWSLYADGYKVVSGTKEFARECFVEDAELFRETCRKAVEESGLPSLTRREYIHLFGVRNMYDYFRTTSDISVLYPGRRPRKNHLLESQ
ncbi:MAG: hypothetical protein IKS49_07285 [Actinomycetaceae bacterium]|nr:hypothetical protein [Actinomycetaceae bacterium]